MAQRIVASSQELASVERTTAQELSVLSIPPTSRGSGSVPLSESLRSSLYSLSANVMRTALTMLGIIIGVGAVVALLAIGNGVVATAREKLERNGTNLITVQGANQRSAGVATGALTNTLTLEDADALAQPGVLPDAAAISPEVGRGGRINVGTVNTFGETLGVWPTYQDVHSYEPSSGDFVSRSGRDQCVARSSISARISPPRSSPVATRSGKTVRFNGNSLSGDRRDGDEGRQRLRLPR